MNDVSFHYRGAAQRVPFGDTFGVPAADGFSDTPANDVQSIIANVRRGRAWREEIAERFAGSRPWLNDIILSPKRIAFWQAMNLPPGSQVLDIGCGWGQLTLPLAQSQHRVVALEPVAERLAFVQAAATQDHCAHQVAFIGADYLDCDFGAVFSTILSVGVLEWVGAFQGQEDPQIRQRRFLRKTRQELAPQGALIIGIENRLGLKYLLGCPDDHIGVPGIAFLSAGLARQRWQNNSGQPLRSFTYSDVELTELLREAGYSTIELFAALPDYKLPEVVVPLHDDGRRFNQMFLDGLAVAEHNGYDGHAVDPVMQENLIDTYRSLAAQGIAHHFAPSFFVRAT